MSPRHPRIHPALAAALTLAVCATAARAERPAYPPTPVREVADTLHGKVLVDPYRWLEPDDAPEVQDWTAAQNAFTRKMLDGLPGREALAKRLGDLNAIPTHSKPRLHAGRLFYWKRSGTQSQPVLMMRPIGGKDEARVVLDPNTLSADGTQAVDWSYVSGDGALLAYGVSSGGSEKSTLAIRRVDSGEDLPERIPHTQFASLAWDPDGKGFLYTRHPKPGDVPAGEEVFHKKVFHHRLGDDPERDAVVYDGAGRPMQENRAVWNSSDRSITFFQNSLDWSKNDVSFRRAGSDGAWTPLATGLAGLTRADAYAGTLYLRSNVDAPRWRVLTADPESPEPANWKVLIPEQAGVIEDMVFAGKRIALAVMENATSRLLLFGLDGKPQGEVTLPALGSISDLQGEPEGNFLGFVFTSFGHPGTVYRYDLTKGTLEPVEKNKGFDPASVVARQEWVTSRDGVEVPVFIVHRKGLDATGGPPTILFGYGGFGVSETPAFRSSVIPWIEAGGVFVQACLRGGGEFGKAWHEAGRLEKKQTVFDDFYACAEWIHRELGTPPARLTAQGGSNGGLLVGAALTQRPELFGAVICQVPLLDMIRYQRFSIARYWVPEYGSSENPEQFPYLLAYSPYQNVKQGTAYPATLITTGASDSRVAPLHARKMAALLQARTGGEAPILLRADPKTGHGAGKPTAKRIEEAVDILSFLMSRMGMRSGS